MLKALEHIGRRLLLRLLGSRRLTVPSQLEAPRSILIIRIDPRVGNVVMLTAFLDELHRAYPSADLTLLGPSKGRALLENAPYLSTFWVSTKSVSPAKTAGSVHFSAFGRRDSTSSSMRRIQPVHPPPRAS